jgi:hypothetical protein
MLEINEIIVFSEHLFLFPTNNKFTLSKIAPDWKAFPFCSMIEKGKDAEAVSLPFLFV